MHRILVCPFGHFNLLLTLFEKLRTRFPAEYEVTYITFTEYGRAICRRLDAPSIHISPGFVGTFFKEPELDEIIRFTSFLASKRFRRNHNRLFKQAANHYGQEIDELLKASNFDSLVEFNGRMNLFITCLDALADLRKVKKLVFEQGLFRPHYVTIDGKGVNRRNSIRSLEKLLSDESFDFQETKLYNDLCSLLPLEPSDIENYKRSVSPLALLFAYLKMRFLPRPWAFLRDADGRDLLEAALLRPRSQAPTTNLAEELFASGKYCRYVLCPLQVESDTQIVIHSPHYKDMVSLVRDVVRAVAKVNQINNQATCVLFKIHPMHPLRISVDEDFAFVINESTIPDLIRRCDLLITINSTSGIEAIEVEKPVITLGDAFYSFPGVISAHVARSGDLASRIHEALEGGTTDPDLQKRFIKALRDKYQVRLFA